MSGGPGSVLPVSSLEKEIWTTLIRGDLDEDDNVFNSIVKAFKENFDDINAGYRHYNKKNLDYGTHARLLMVAAMMTHTKLLHGILEDDNKKENRLLVSADSDPAWLDRFSDLSSPSHQLILVQPCTEEENPYKYLFV